MKKLLAALMLAVLPQMGAGDMINQDVQAVECLARNMYHEARGETISGIRAVGHVTMNRVKHAKFPSTVCGVVYQKFKRSCQFSWVCSKTSLPKKEHYEKIKSIAREVYYGSSKDPTRGATHFHHRGIQPAWRGFLKTTAIGNHVFYRERER